MLKDETVWEKPNQFYPEHFLDAKGQFVKPEAFLPFSAGKCVRVGSSCKSGAQQEGDLPLQQF